eukprot:CAMPEP_0179239030 /NCGR_PEP_ID=MMETSP0797-20121207/15254_1 /TAXON_ID=47934 /ORGANISM="Dinophysis acuminata, Strain DAEP01" /LENGTH=298 /DNA_ID=CAMNT_0020946347 /DNA_START=81 /DNA_END=974 /DNA_ORIENTATION=-
MSEVTTRNVVPLDTRGWLEAASVPLIFREEHQAAPHTICGLRQLMLNDVGDLCGLDQVRRAAVVVLLVLAVRVVFGPPRSVDTPGAERCDADARASGLVRDCVHEADHAVLRRDVARLVRDPPSAGDRRDGDNAAGVAAHHVLQHGMRHVHDALEVHVDKPVHILDGELPEGLAIMSLRSIGDQHVDAAELFQHCGHSPGHRVAVRYVTREGHCILTEDLHTASSFSSLRAKAATDQPFFAKWHTRNAPTPEDAPVTNMTPAVLGFFTHSPSIPGGRGTGTERPRAVPTTPDTGTCLG